MMPGGLHSRSVHQSRAESYSLRDCDPTAGALAMTSTSVSLWRSRVAPRLRSQDPLPDVSVSGADDADANDGAVSPGAGPDAPEGVESAEAAGLRQRPTGGVRFGPPMPVREHGSDPDMYGDSDLDANRVTPRFASTAMNGTCGADPLAGSPDLTERDGVALSSPYASSGRVADSLRRQMAATSARKPYSPFAAAADDAMDANLEDAFDGDGDSERLLLGSPAASTGAGEASTSPRQDERVLRTLRATRKRALAKAIAGAHDADLLDVLVIFLTQPYPIKRLRRIRRQAQYLREVRAQQDDGVDDAEVTDMLRDTPRSARAGAYHADVVIFDAAFDKGYVDRLTTRLDRRVARRMEDYQSVARDKPLRSLPMRERFWTALHRQTANNPYRQLLHSASDVMLRRLHGTRTSAWDIVAALIVIALQRVFHFFTPNRLRLRRHSAYTPWHTYMMLALTLAVFAFMAGEYPYWLLHTGQRAIETPSTPPPVGPRALWEYLRNPSEPWRAFNGYYLIRWGAMYPSLVRQSSRWVTSTLVHADALHILSNTLLFVALGTYIERKHGTWRAACAFWLSALAGTLFSVAMSGGACAATVGSSGGVFGLLGVFISDVLLNFAAVSYPAYRVFAVLLFGIVWAASSTKGSSDGISHVSHGAGVVYGFCIGMLYLPSLPFEMLETIAPILGVLVSACVFALPIMSGVLEQETTCPDPDDLLDAYNCVRAW